MLVNHALPHAAGGRIAWTGCETISRQALADSGCVTNPSSSGHGVMDEEERDAMEAEIDECDGKRRGRLDGGRMG